MTHYRSYVSRSGQSLSWATYLFLAVMIFAWFAFFLDNRPFATPDEGRYVEIPREMLASGDFVTPRLNGVKYFEKPPLFYWMEAGAQWVFGLSEGPMRLWGIFLATLGCLGTAAFGARFFSARLGVTSALLLALTPLYFALSRLIILDMPVTVFVSLSLFVFLTGVYMPPGWKRRGCFYIFAILCALGVLTKGIMALAIPGPIIVIWATVTRQWRFVFPAYIPSSTILFAIIAAPWHVLAHLRNEDFAYKYFIVEHVLRFLTDVHLRSKPFWFYVPILLVGLFPWTPFVLRGAREGFRDQNPEKVTSFLLIWILWVFVFFSAATSKLIPYILPTFPPLILLATRGWLSAWDMRDHHHQAEFFRDYWRSVALCGAMALLLGIGGLVVFPVFPQVVDHLLSIKTQIEKLSAVILALGILMTAGLMARRLKIALGAIPVMAVTIIIGLVYLSPHLQKPSLKPIAEEILAMKQPEDLVVSYKTYFQDLPVYLKQTVIVVESLGELEFGVYAEDTSAWMIREQTFLDLWKQDKRLLVAARQNDLDDLTKRFPDFSYHLVTKSHNNLLITNRKP